MPSFFETGSQRLVGRAAEVARLVGVLEEVQANGAHTILLTGEPGIGKSRLVRETMRLAAERDFFIVRGRCFEQDRSMPYAPLVDLADDLARREQDSQPVSALLPRLTELVHALADPSAGTSPDREYTKRTRMEEMVQLLLARAPCLIAIEDLHWGDEGTFEFLVALVRRMTGQAILLLLSFRAEEASPPLQHLLAALAREQGTDELELKRLTPDETAEFTRALAGPETAVPVEFSAAVYELTDGNPFFVEQVMQAQAQQAMPTSGLDAAALRGMKIPRTIRDAVQTRVAHVSPRAREVATYAAVIGRRFEFELLQSVLGIHEGELLAALRELIDAQLVSEDSPDRFLFRHALTQQAIYRSLLGRECRAIHARVAATLEQNADRNTGGDKTRAAALDELANHFYRAGDWSKTVHWGTRAGRAALARYAPLAAVEHTSHALEAVTQPGIPGGDAIELYRLRGQAYEILGEFEGARADYLQVLDLARESRDRRAEWQALLDLGFLWAARDADSTQTYLEQALYVARELNDPATLARTLNRVGNWHAISLQFPRAFSLHQEAAELLSALGDEPGLAETLDLQGVAHLIGGDFSGAATYYERAIPLWRRLQEPRGLASSLLSLAMCNASYTGEVVASPPRTLRESILLADEADRLARDIDWKAGQGLASIALAIAWGGMGEYRNALAAGERAAALSQETEHRQNATLASWILGTLYLDIFAFEPARVHLEQALEDAYVSAPNWVPLTLARLVSLYVRRDDLVRAEGLLNSFLTPDVGARGTGERAVWAARAELALAQGDFKLAQAIGERLVNEAALDEHQNRAAMPLVAFLYGSALMGSRRKREAALYLDAAVGTAEERGLDALLWRVLIARGKLYQTTARGAAARETFQRAQTILAKLAATIPDPEMAANFLKHAGARIPRAHAPTAADAAKKRFGGLSVRERQIAVRVAQGQSNREIAEGLVLSQRTVESHVTNILSKLGLRARAQIAAWVVEHGLI